MDKITDPVTGKGRWVKTPEEKAASAARMAAVKAEAATFQPTDEMIAFVYAGILEYRDTSKSLGLNAGISGFNAAFAIAFPDVKPSVCTQAMVNQGKLALVPTSFPPFAPILYLPNEKPSSLGNAANNAANAAAMAARIRGRMANPKAKK